MRLSDPETRQEMLFLDSLFTRDAVMQFNTFQGMVAVTVRTYGRTQVYTFTPEHAAVLARGIQKVMLGDEILTRAFEPISDQLLDMVGRIEHGVDARRSRT